MFGLAEGAPPERFLVGIAALDLVSTSVKSNPGPIFKHYGENVRAAVSAHLDAVTEHAAAPVIAKYTGVLGGADRDHAPGSGPSLPSAT